MNVFDISTAAGGSASADSDSAKPKPAKSQTLTHQFIGLEHFKERSESVDANGHPKSTVWNVVPRESWLWLSALTNELSETVKSQLERKTNPIHLCQTAVDRHLFVFRHFWLVKEIGSVILSLPDGVIRMITGYATVPMHLLWFWAGELLTHNYNSRAMNSSSRTQSKGFGASAVRCSVDDVLPLVEAETGVFALPQAVAPHAVFNSKTC